MAIRGNPFRWVAELGALLVMCLLGAATLGLLGALNSGQTWFTTGLLAAALPVPLYLLLALWIDRYEKEPLSMLALAFLWGATGAIFFSLLLNTLSAEFLGALAGEGVAEFGTTVLTAPLVEELSKGAALLLLFLWKEHEFDNVIDGILYATMVGLGFAMTENISYYGEALRTGPDASRIAFVVRGMLTPFAHPFFTAMTGIGLGVAREGAPGPLRLGAPLLGLSAAILLHAVWNLSTGFGAVFFGAYFLVMVPCFLGLLGLVLFAQQRERKIIHAHFLLGYRKHDVCGPQELYSLCRWGGRFRALRTAWKSSGLSGWRRERRRHQLLSELAFHHWRVSRGLSRGPAADAAFEAEHLEELYRLRPVSEPLRLESPETPPPARTTEYR